MKLLLLADLPPCQNLTGGLVIDQMCRFLPPGSISALIVLNPHINARLSDDLSWMPIAYTRKRNEATVNSRKNFWSRMEAMLAEQLYRNIVGPRLIRQAVRFAKDQKVDGVWAVLQGQVIAQMAPALAAKLKVPLWTQVWDPLSWWLLANNVDAYNSRMAQKDFDRAIAMSRGAIAASEPMAAHYYKTYGTTSLPIIASHPKTLGEPPATAITGDTVRLGMAGQFYASEEWLLLVDALDQVNWTIGGKHIKVIAMGPQKPPGEDSPDRVEFLGWKTQPEAVKVLAGCDILICPYPFSGTMREVAELSFPSKVPLYLAAGRPVLFIGPSYSSPTSYIRQRGIGVAVGDPLMAAVIDGLMRLIMDPVFYAEAAQAAAKAFLDDFTLDTMRTRFAEILGVGIKDGYLDMNAGPASTTPVEPMFLPSVVDEDYSYAGLEKKLGLQRIFTAWRQAKVYILHKLLPKTLDILQRFYIRRLLGLVARVLIPYRRKYLRQSQAVAARDTLLALKEREITDLWQRVNGLHQELHRLQNNEVLQDDKDQRLKAIEKTLIEEGEVGADSRQTGSAAGSARPPMSRYTSLESLHRVVEIILQEDISGDILQAGIQRSDAPVYLSALLGNQGGLDRKIWVATSVIEGESSVEKRRARGLPAKAIPSEELSQIIRNRLHQHRIFGAVVQTVDWPLEHTLYTMPISRLAVIYLDGDTFESVMVILNTQYFKLSPGGLVIADRYTDAVKAAVDHFREQHHIHEHLKRLPDGGAFWQTPHAMRQAAE